MDQLIYASLSHIYYWYEVRMLKVPARLYIAALNNDLVDILVDVLLVEETCRS